ncbi:MAG: hypothetical protein C4305_04000 [Thermoleophilia bacterium]
MSEYALEQTDADETFSLWEASVEGWRFEVLLRAGYPAALADEVARSRADLHLAADLVLQGCDSELAARILL